jgi:hypothetical protein
LEKIFDITLKNRKILYNILKETPRETLLKIPNGYRNNIWWNIAHVVVTQQRLVYKMSNLPMRISDELADKFTKGTVPDGTATQDEMDEIEGYLLATVEWVQQDFENGIFKTFNEYTTTPGVTLTCVEDSLAFNAFHEGLHLGVIISLKKAMSL